MKWYWKAHRMDERGNFSFVLLIVIIIRTASSWLQQQHNTTLRSTIFLKCWHSFCWFICSFSFVVGCCWLIFSAFLISIHFRSQSFQARDLCLHQIFGIVHGSNFWSIIFDLFNIYYAVLYKCHKRMRLSTPHLTQIQALMWHIHSAQNAQGQSQWIVLKSKPNKMQIQDEEEEEKNDLYSSTTNNNTIPTNQPKR